MSCISFCGKEYRSTTNFTFTNENSNIYFYIFSNALEVLYDRKIIFCFYDNKAIITLNEDLKMQILESISMFSGQVETPLSKEFEKVLMFI